jgi:hypothetical protein
MVDTERQLRLYAQAGKIMKPLKLTRRVFAGNILKTSAALTLPWNWLCRADASEPRLRFAEGPPIEVPSNFTGLGYEALSVATPGLLSPANQRYVKLIRELGPQGVLRVGGIVSDYTSYIADAAPVNDRKNTVITRASLEQFAAFLGATGWTTIWSVNFAQGTIEQAIEEARAVAQTLGTRLLALEIGNEVENYGNSSRFRHDPYTYEQYSREFHEWRTAIARAVPVVRFAGPDTAQSVDWVERMASEGKGEVQLLTTHYYRNGQARGSAEQLMAPDHHLDAVIARMRTASQQSGIPWRMCEINSFSGGGLLGVSDTFLGALWTLKTMMLLAQNGCSGVNMETGVNQLGFVSSYSPIQDDGKGMNSAGVPYYGMLAFAAAFSGCHQVLPLEVNTLGEGVCACVFGSGGKPRSIVIVNMTPSEVKLSTESVGVDKASVLWLTAPTLESRTGVSFGGGTVGAGGHWKLEHKDRLRNGTVTVSKFSAAVLRVGEE